MAKIPEQGIINTNQYLWILFIIIPSFTVLQVPGLLIFQAGRDAWLSVATAWFLDILIAVLYAYMGIRFPGENCVQYSSSILGKIFGKLVGLLFISFFLIVSVSLMRALAININNVLLPKTPLEIILLGAYIIIAYIVRKGIEVIARICEVLGPLFLLSIVGLFVLVIPSIHLDRLKPQLDYGLYPFLSGAVLLLTTLGICIAMGWYIPLCNRPENGFPAKFKAASLGAFMISLVVVSGIGIFGVEQASNMTNPGLEIARFIHIGDYFERMEVIWMVIAIGAGIMTAINTIWIFSLGVAQIVEVKTYKPLVYPTALVSLALCLTSFPDNTSYLSFAFYSFPILGLLIQGGLGLLLLIAALISGKKGKS